MSYLSSRCSTALHGQGLAGQCGQIQTIPTTEERSSGQHSASIWEAQHMSYFWVILDHTDLCLGFAFLPNIISRNYLQPDGCSQQLFLKGQKSDFKSFLLSKKLISLIRSFFPVDFKCPVCFHYFHALCWQHFLSRLTVSLPSSLRIWPHSLCALTLCSWAKSLPDFSTVLCLWDLCSFASGENFRLLKNRTDVCMHLSLFISWLGKAAGEKA